MRRCLFVFFLLSAIAFTATEEGFVSLFNGRDLTGWELFGGKGPGYIVEDGKIVCPADGGGNLWTKKEYGDFVLRFDFKMEPGGNNGIGIRSPATGDAAYQGMEIQILDHFHDRYQGKLKPTQYHGSVYDVFPAAKTDALRPAGEWNSEEIRVDGRKITVTLNGKVILDRNLDDMKDPEVLKKHPGLARKSGHIGFLGHGTRVEFRNLRIKPLR